MKKAIAAAVLVICMTIAALVLVFNGHMNMGLGIIAITNLTIGIYNIRNSSKEEKR